MRHRIDTAITCLHISAVLYFFVGIAMFFFFRAQDDTGVGLAFGIGFFVFCLGLIVGIEVVAYGLQRRKFWAWVLGLAIFGLYIPSLFLPLGALGMWGLLDSGSLKAFGIGGTSPS